jgi:hypothetical protein
MTSDRGAPGAKAKVRNALKRVDSEFDQRGPDIALDRQDAEVMGLCRDVVSKEAWKRWSANACQDAVKNDSIERLKFLHESGCPWRKNKILYVYAEHGSVKCMKYLLKHGCEFSNQACTTAAEFGFLECLKYLREHGHHWDSGTCEYAAKRGHLECLKYAHEHGCPWDENTCYNAADNGHLECLKYACAHGCPGSAPYVKALKEVVLPDADERFVVEVALVFHRSGEISMREFLPLWAEHRMFYRKAHHEAVRKFHASLRLNR